MLGIDRGRAHDHLGAVGAEHGDLVGRDLVGADEDAAVAPLLGDDGEPDAGVAAGGLDDDAARAAARRDASAASTMRTAMRSFTEPPGFRNSSLARTERVALRAGPELHERRVTDELDDAAGERHGLILPASPRFTSDGRCRSAEHPTTSVGTSRPRRERRPARWCRG